jgi:hypothetical protein
MKPQTYEDLARLLNLLQEKGVVRYVADGFEVLLTPQLDAEKPANPGRSSEDRDDDGEFPYRDADEPARIRALRHGG